jgi:hypothetical protein
LGSTDPSTPARSRLARHAHWLLLGPTLVAIVAVYLFFVTAGRGDAVALQSRYFSTLADAFLDGHLYLGVRPSPELLAKANPYDPANQGLWVWDTTLHDGRYYLYWGPVPALLAAAVKLVGGRTLLVSDGWLALAFVLGRLAVGTAILSLALRRLFPTLSPWLAAPAVAVFGLANPYLYTLGRVVVYEAAIEGAQLFLLTGLLLGMLATGSGSQRRQRALALAAGCAWAVALACRISLIAAVLALIPLAAWLSSPAGLARRREAALRTLWIGAPIALSLLALGWYNQARFGSWTDFGAAHQLGLVPYSFSPLRFLANLHAYLLRQPLLTCHFPYLFTPFLAERLTPSWVFARQTGYMPLEPTVGMLIAVPCAVFGVSADDRRHRLYLWLVSACLVIALLAGLPALGMNFSTMRFLADVTSGVLVLAAIGFWTRLSRASSAGRRRRVAGLGALLGL